MPIVEEAADRWRFLKCLYFLNDANHPTPWERDVDRLGDGLHFNRPDSWVGERKPLVDILAYCLMDNHFHIVLKERQEGGAAAFMKSLASSMTETYNKKYNTDGGSIFGGRPKKRFVETDQYLKFLYVYVNVKNPFERHSEGLSTAINDFDAAFSEILSYPFSSLADCMDERNSPIVSLDMFSTLFASPNDFKEFAREQMHRYQVFLQDVDAEDLE